MLSKLQIFVMRFNKVLCRQLAVFEPLNALLLHEPLFHLPAPDHIHLPVAQMVLHEHPVDIQGSFHHLLQISLVKLFPITLPQMLPIWVYDLYDVIYMHRVVVKVF